MALRLLDPQTTAAIVLGAHDWTNAGLARAPTFRRSAKDIVRYLMDSAGLGLDSELVLDLFDDPSPAAEQLGRIRETLEAQLRERREAGRPVTDVLVYYVGHGQTDDQGHLSLLVRKSLRGMEMETSLKAPDLARVLKISAPLQRRIVFLDCCFSEAAARDFIGMSGSLNEAVAAVAAKDFKDGEPRRGTLLLCSSPVGEISIAPQNATHTLFTGAVLDVLREGVEGRADMLSLADLRDAVYERSLQSFGANAPQPALHQVNAADGDLTRAGVFPNRAFRGEAAIVRQEAERQAAEALARREAEQRAAEARARRESEQRETEALARRDAERQAGEDKARQEAEQRAAAEKVRHEAEQKAAKAKASREAARRRAAKEAASAQAKRPAVATEQPAAAASAALAKPAERSPALAKFDSDGASGLIFAVIGGTSVFFTLRSLADKNILLFVLCGAVALASHFLGIILTAYLKPRADYISRMQILFWLNHAYVIAFIFYFYQLLAKKPDLIAWIIEIAVSIYFLLMLWFASDMMRDWKKLLA